VDRFTLRVGEVGCEDKELQGEKKSTRMKGNFRDREEVNLLTSKKDCRGTAQGATALDVNLTAMVLEKKGGRSATRKHSRSKAAGAVPVGTQRKDASPRIHCMSGSGKRGGKKFRKKLVLIASRWKEPLADTTRKKRTSRPEKK